VYVVLHVAHRESEFPADLPEMHAGVGRDIIEYPSLGGVESLDGLAGRRGEWRGVFGPLTIDDKGPGDLGEQRFGFFMGTV
jgi:hypothetical protein